MESRRSKSVSNRKEERGRERTHSSGIALETVEDGVDGLELDLKLLVRLGSDDVGETHGGEKTLERSSLLDSGTGRRRRWGSDKVAKEGERRDRSLTDHREKGYR